MLTYEDFDYYQLQAESTAVFTDPYYPFASLMIEAAEFCDLVTKPMLRGDDKEIDKQELISEAGDVLWNLAVALKRQGIHLSEVAKYNHDKLQSRQARGVLKGDGGDR